MKMNVCGFAEVKVPVLAVRKQSLEDDFLVEMLGKESLEQGFQVGSLWLVSALYSLVAGMRVLSLVDLED
jgi:hypothetical protein